MVVLRCTRRLLGRMGAKPVADPVPPSTGVLGDWFATPVTLGREQSILATSARSLLPVLLPAAPYKTLPQRLPGAVAQVLLALGIPPAAVALEIASMGEVRVTKTNDRRVLGTMNDFLRMFTHGFSQEPTTLLDDALLLAMSPCSPVGMNSPDRLTRDLFARLRTANDV